MKKSKYEVNPLDIMKMSTQQLKDYIRGASKSFSKRIKAFESMPYGSASETMQYIEKSGATFAAGKSRFSVAGLTRDELISKAQGLNVIASLNETPAAFQKEVDAQITEMTAGLTSEQAAEVLSDMFLNKANFEMLREYVDIHMDSIYSLISSDRVNELANDYEEDTEEFYTQLMKETIYEYSLVERSRRSEFFREKRKPKKKRR